MAIFVKYEDRAIIEKLTKLVNDNSSTSSTLKLIFPELVKKSSRIVSIYDKKEYIYSCFF
jgi:hypothetical protein